MVQNRLSKVMARLGVASRRKCEELIFLGQVRVNGAVIKKPETQVNSERDRIEVRKEVIGTHIRSNVYFAFHKPIGYICTHHGISIKRTIYAFFQNFPFRLFSAGRLDKDTSGLLIVTNDGEFVQKVIHPSADITKEYLVKTLQEIEHEHLVTIMKGAVVEGSFVQPVSVEKVRKGTCKIVVKEGRKHEVRTLIACAGLTIVDLKRIRIGSLVLGSLPIGGIRPLARHEVSQLIGEA